MEVTAAEVRRIADLARLEIGDAEAATLAAQLGSILGHMEVLSRAGTDGLARQSEPSAVRWARESMPLREDAVAPPPMRVPVTALAAEAADGFILVPRLETHDDEAEDSAIEDETL